MIHDNQAATMSMRRVTMLAAVQSSQNNTTTSSIGTNYQYLPGYNMSSNVEGKSGRFETDLHGNVNVLLGGTMLSGVIIVVILVCYCCHRNIRKNRPQEYSPYWRAEPDVQSLEVFTMDAHSMGRFLGASQYSDRTIGNSEEMTTMSLPCPGTPGPPPAYESLIFNPQALPSPSDKKEEPLTPDENNIPPLVVNSETDQAPPVIEKKDDDTVEDEGLPTYEAALKLEANGYV